MTELTVDIHDFKVHHLDILLADQLHNVLCCFTHNRSYLIFRSIGLHINIHLFNSFVNHKNHQKNTAFFVVGDGNPP